MTCCGNDWDNNIFTLLTRRVKNFWQKLEQSSKPVILFGAGGKGKAALATLKQKGIQPLCFCDNNPSLQSKLFEGLDCLAYHDLKKYGQYIILITTTPEKAVQIEQDLKKLGEKNLIFHFCVPFKLDYKFYNPQVLMENKSFYRNFYKNLIDVQSKEIFVKNLYYKCTGNALPLQTHLYDSGFFDIKLMPNHGQHIYLDVGAFTGDTLQMFHDYCNGQYKAMLAIEPDEENFSCLKTLVHNKQWANVSLYKTGVYNKKCILNFHSMSGEGAFNANIFKSPATMMDRHYMMEVENGLSKPKSTEISMDTIDNIIQGRPVSIIKTNAMAADLMVLEGAYESIKRHKPAVVLDYGSSHEDLLGIPKYLMDTQVGYKFYLRQKQILCDSKTLLYAI